MQNSAAGCCQFCKRTANCTAWGYNITSRDCLALLKCTSGIQGFDVQSGSVHGKMPHAKWPKGQPPVVPLPFRNASLPIDERLAWLINNLTLDEKIGLFATRSGAIPRLAIRTYTYYTECNSGACANGHCTQSKCPTVNLTVFPQSPSMAATFNLTLERLKGDVIGRELRAIGLSLKDDFNSFFGLSCFSPMINIIRDPFWGRNNEAYSECPFLTGEFAHAVIRGMRQDTRGSSAGGVIQAFGGCKHFVPYDGAALSHASDYDLFSTYLPGFERCIEAGALNIMCSYSQVGLSSLVIDMH